ncbi:MAG: DUF4382 domain-containing protein [Candidatus Thiodiazotropha sp.]
MSKRPTLLGLVPLLLLVVSLLSACGGGGSSSSPATAGRTGAVALMLTDAPADPSLFSEINATIERVELIGGDGGRVSLFEGPAETVDLLKLRNESVPFTFRDDVPVGTYCKVRLTLTNPRGLELVLAADSSSYYPKLPGNGKLDLLARDCFTVAPGAAVTLQLDMDAGNSIHIVKTGNKTDYNFRPVVFIDVINRSYTGKLVRLEGVIADYDAVAQNVLLCDALPTHQASDADCALIELGADSAYFDNLAEQGDALPLDDLFMQANLDQPAAAVGLVNMLAIDLEAPSIPSGSEPGAGFCLIWDPAAAAPVSDDVACDDPLLIVPTGTVLIDETGSVVVDHRPRLALDGLAVETGAFTQAYGSANGDATMDEFLLEAGSSITVALQNPSGYNGTRILTKEGGLLDYTAILSGRMLKLDGVMTSATNLKAAVVIVDTDMQGLTAASGTIGSTSTGGFILIPETGTTPCGVSGDLAVQLATDASLTTVVITDTLVDVSPGGILETGQSVSVSGVCGTDSLTASTVVIVDDQR